MKLNWGTGIVIAFVIFAALLTVAMVLGSMQRVDLVTPDYYERELQFQDQIDFRENAQHIGDLIISASATELTIKFPSPIDFEHVSGKVSFYKPDNANFDFEQELKLNEDNVMIINREKRIGGLWTVMVLAEQDGTSYYWEEKINM